MSLKNIDLVFIFLYFFLILGVAYWKSKRKSKEDFLIAERKLGVIGTLSTINASKTGSIILLFVAALYEFGFSAIWYFGGTAIGYLVFISFAKKLHDKHGKNSYTLADYFFKNYGNFAGKCASILNILVMFGWLAINLIASSKVLEMFTGLSFETAALVVSLVVLIYLLIGGFKSVVTTDIVQYIAIISVFVIFAFILFTNVKVPASEWNLTATGIQNIVSFILIGIIIPFGSPELWQRVYAVKDKKTLQKGIFYSVVFYLGAGCILALIGLAIKTMLPLANPDTALIEGFATLLPAGLSGLAVVIFFAAFMSSIDTYAYTAASSFVHDFFKKINKSKIVKRVRISIVAVVVLGTIAAIFIKDLFLGAYIFISYVVAVAMPVIATWIKPSITREAVNASLIISMIVLSLYVAIQAVNKTLSPMILMVGMGTSILGLFIGGIVSFLKKKEKRKFR